MKRRRIFRWPDAWLRRRLFAWSAGMRARAICGPNGEPYLERYMVCRLPPVWPFRGGRVYLHRFVASDPDRGLHDHPWRWAVSLILAGGYDELRLTRFGPTDARVETVTRRAPAVNLLSGRSFHRVVLRAEDMDHGGETVVVARDTWSLFVRPGRSKPWGFLRWRFARGAPSLAASRAAGLPVVERTAIETSFRAVEDSAESDPATWGRARDLRAAGALRGTP